MKTKKTFLSVAIMAAVFITSCGKKEVTGITLDKTAITLDVGQTETLTATILPKNAVSQEIVWSSDNTAVATVNAGVVVAHSVGTAIIAATTGNFTATCVVTVIQSVESITLNKSTLNLYVGGTETLTATVIPDNITVVWTSSDASVASVENGVVTANAVGNTTITASAGDKTATCVVTVSVESITLNKSTLSLFVGGTETLTATVIPDNVTVVWTSSDASVASVENGVVTANSVGNATITASAGDKTATCVVTVTSNPFYDAGVVINGVKWATRNVDDFGTFAPTPESLGMFYQWNRQKAWAATGSVTGWDSSYPTGNTWAAENDPCPNGWRVPTSAEIESLLNTTYVTWAWTTLNYTNGYRFTYIATGNSIFMPAVGYRGSDYGTLYGEGTLGSYWSSAMQSSSTAYYLNLPNSVVYLSDNDLTYGFSVRCVAE